MGARTRTAYLTFLLGLCLAVPAAAQTDLLPHESRRAAAQRLCIAAVAVAESDPDAARARYLRALDLKPDEPCAARGVAVSKLTKEEAQANVDAALAQAVRRKDLGLDSDASTQVGEALKSAESVDPPLEVDLPAVLQPDTVEPAHWFNEYVLPWIKLVAALLAAIIVFILAVRVLGRWGGRWLEGRLVVQPFSGDHGDAVATAFRAEYRRLRGRHPTSPAMVDDLEVDAEDVTPEAVGSLVPQANAVSGLLRWVASALPTRRISGGTVASTGGHGDGLRVRLRAPVRLKKGIGNFGPEWEGPHSSDRTLVAEDWLPGRSAIASPSTCELLATPAVVWTLARFDAPRLTCWRAEAHLALGQRLHTIDPSQARANYVRALERSRGVPDQTTRERIDAAARVNLASLEMRSRGGMTRAAAWLVPLRTPPKGLSLYTGVRIAYWETVIAMSQSVHPVSDQERLERARAAARKLLRRIAAVKGGKPDHEATPSELERQQRRRDTFVERNAGCAAALLLSTVVAVGEGERLRDGEREALHAILAVAPDDPGDPASWVEAIVIAHPWPNAGFAYNLALYYACCEAVARACWMLRMALSQSRTLQGAVLLDPWLEPLRGNGDDWADLLAEFGLSPGVPTTPAATR